ncbi:DUF1963 domain-containing protein [Streptomyces sp. NPDC059781]|uniref:DUF1963 domain-containing protein n=1 Tax=unclassified Streptomyces TaxID=2593676 RepID=UPI00365F6AB5
MTNLDEFRSSALESGVSEASLALILKHLRPAYGLGYGKEAVGYLGGYPELPVGMTWDGDEVFIASIDLGALPEHDLDTGLPREGRLLLFGETWSGLTMLDWTDGPPSFPYALYIPPGTETVPWDPSSAGDSFDENYVIKRQPLAATTIWDMDGNMDADDFHRDPADMDDEEREMYDEAVALREAIEEFRSLAGHLSPLNLDGWGDLKLCGVAHCQQEEVEIEVVDRVERRKRGRAEHGEGPHPDEYESGLATREEQQAAWRPLAEAGQDNLFGEGDGALYWVVPRTDLAVPRFDRTELVYQC